MDKLKQKTQNKNLIIQTLPFIDKYAQKELTKFTKNKIFIISKGNYKIEFNCSSSNDEILEFITNILYYSRTIQFVYLEQSDCENIDLFGFDLTQRDYMINKNDSEDVENLNSIILNYALYLLEIDKEKNKYSIIDPLCNLGETIIEISQFNPRMAVNIKKRLNLPLNDIFGSKLKLPKQELKDKNKYVGIVQDNRKFKLLKENINYVNAKIKMSLYELDWLDVKFKKEALDYVLTHLPYFDLDDEEEIEEFLEIQNGFFYQSEFIAKKKICVICQNELDKKIIKKHNLVVNIKEEIEFNGEKYYIYIICK